MPTDLRATDAWRSGLVPDLSARNEAARHLAEAADREAIDGLLDVLADGVPDEADLALRALKAIRSSVFAPAQRDRWARLTAAVVKQHYYSFPLGNVAFSTLKALDRPTAERFLREGANLEGESDSNVRKAIDDLAVIHAAWSTVLLERLAHERPALRELVEHKLRVRGVVPGKVVEQLARSWRESRSRESLEAIYEAWVRLQHGRPAGPVLQALGEPDVSDGWDNRYEGREANGSPGIQLTVLVSDGCIEAIKLS